MCNASDDTYWEDPNIVSFYGDLILAGTVNAKTNEPWKVEDVSERWRSAVEEYVNRNTPNETETTEEPVGE